MADYRLHVQWISLVIYARRCTQTPTNKSYRSSGWHCNQKPLAQPSLPLGWHRSLQYYQTQPEKKNGVQVYKCKELGKNPLILNTHNVLECGYADFQAQSSIDNGQYASKNIEACASIQAKKYSCDSHTIFLTVKHACKRILCTLTVISKITQEMYESSKYWSMKKLVNLK